MRCFENHEMRFDTSKVLSKYFHRYESFRNLQRWWIIMLTKKGNSLAVSFKHKIPFNSRGKTFQIPVRTAFRQIIASNNIIIIFSTPPLSLSTSLHHIKIALCFQYKYICGMETRRKSLENLVWLELRRRSMSL